MKTCTQQTNYLLVSLTPDSLLKCESFVENITSLLQIVSTERNGLCVKIIYWLLVKDHGHETANHLAVLQYVHQYIVHSTHLVGWVFQQNVSSISSVKDRWGRCSADQHRAQVLQIVKILSFQNYPKFNRTKMVLKSKFKHAQ